MRMMSKLNKYRSKKYARIYEFSVLKKQIEKVALKNLSFSIISILCFTSVRENTESLLKSYIHREQKRLQCRIAKTS